MQCCYFLSEKESSQRNPVEIETLHRSEFTPLFRAISVPFAKAVRTEIANLFLWASHTAVDFDIAQMGVDHGSVEVGRNRNPWNVPPTRTAVGFAGMVLAEHTDQRIPKSMAVCGGRPTRFAISAFTAFWYCAEIA